jgi:ATP-dependent Clp protease ATP-binding subunit ClpA
MSKQAIGFGRGLREDEDSEAIKRMFTPEFRNRLDSVIHFSGLDLEIVERVVDKFVAQLETQLADRKVDIVLSDEARKWLAGKGYDRLMGARPLARYIQEHVKKPLAEELLFGKLEKGGTVKVVLVDGALSFEFLGPTKSGPKALPAGAEPKRLSKPSDKPDDDQGGDDPAGDDGKVPEFVH